MYYLSSLSPSGSYSTHLILILLPLLQFNYAIYLECGERSAQQMMVHHSVLNAAPIVALNPPQPTIPTTIPTSSSSSGTSRNAKSIQNNDQKADSSSPFSPIVQIAAGAWHSMAINGMVLIFRYDYR